jgi:thiosulfate/3-mercaptopyruvate sulfurtransferase
MHSTLVSAAELAARLGDRDWCIFDCRHDLQDTAYGEKAYARGHIPGARFLHLDRDLCGAKTGRDGRHPLPDRQAFAEKMAARGVGERTQVVAYDNEGSVFAARLWWMLRWIGHDRAAVLDGGLPCWRRARLPLDGELPRHAAAKLAVHPGAVPVSVDEVLARLGDPRTLMLDARPPERFSGEEEDRDPVAGHIAGAVNRPHFDSLDDAGCLLRPAAELRAEFAQLLAGRQPADVVHLCGSGVTACLNLLAMEVAGLPGSRLYAGSWSEWCADPARPWLPGE